MIKLGTNLPKHLIGSDLGAMRAFVSAVEDLGYSYLCFGDHVLGADFSARPDWKPQQGTRPSQTLDDTQPEIVVLFGLLSGMIRTLELSSAILIGPQRQTALLAKQTAQIDIFTGGKFRLVTAVGWSDVEYEALGVDFHKRGAIMDEQVDVLRRLWTERSVTYHGKYHTINAAGLNPLPTRRIPIWFGGQSEPVLRRVGEVGDGWFPFYPWFIKERLYSDFETVKDYARGAGRDPSEIGLEGAFYWGDDRFAQPKGSRSHPRSLDDAIEYAHIWKEIGANYLWVSTPWIGAEAGQSPYSPKKLGENDLDIRIDALRKFKEAVGPDF